MISSLRGRVAHVEAESVVVEVGGVGLAVHVTPQVARTAHVGHELALHTNLIVREDALTLFGFSSRDELVVFSQLLGVTGVGPKSALGVLSALTVGQIADAVAADDDAPFRRVSGIGPKTAKLIVVQLAGKLAPVHATAGAAPDAAPVVSAQVTQALVGLGWSERIAAEAVASVAADAGEHERASVSALLRLTLAVLGPARKESVGG
ncbi:Holliday junction branch migration protein RuvA [Microbacterium ulmi]|uniref:Holliday junction branch migration complex subunit RuvA n=1 Tax=Microbacterium ulmi TaxID=179095 RepID=A0A7Y2M0H8_9MICO|nr:Holliday junction branch migration protein RuvA [Microbacterium ulmi]NII70989.1 Holliday junction DNA helicase RuvA [Microbacterium ulmi]NNH04245.1 Holliday junction branch migration protein RuvA [Microbacterium ulmi]